ncbi:MAG: RluA family pseudouridine synthase, partial [Treponemataceae bacterium]|nr:RluA family pseudouridine synthase [Treponemataceae bacterium]
MFPPFPENLARLEAEKLKAELDSGLFAEFLEDAPGQMFGVAVCARDDSLEVRDGGGTVVLRAFSGQLAGEGRWILPGFVPPCIDVEKWNEEVRRADPGIKALTAKIKQLGDSSEKTALIAERKKLSRESLKNIYGMYEFACFDGHIETYKSIADDLFNGDIFAIPTGTGDCCAPKLINFAYKNNLKILSMAEFFYGREPASGLKKHRTFYPPCDEKCGIILPKMLGLNILYRDEEIIVVDKPSGVLSIPGRGPEKADSIATRVRTLVPTCIEQPTAHRLDMDTSGLLVLGLTAQAQRDLSIQFQNRTVVKKYRALL